MSKQGGEEETWSRQSKTMGQRICRGVKGTLDRDSEMMTRNPACKASSPPLSTTFAFAGVFFCSAVVFCFLDAGVRGGGVGS